MALTNSGVERYWTDEGSWWCLETVTRRDSELAAGSRLQASSRHSGEAHQMSESATICSSISSIDSGGTRRCHGAKRAFSILESDTRTAPNEDNGAELGGMACLSHSVAFEDFVT